MAGKRKAYTAEYKLAAVKMIADPKRSVAEVARRLGVTENRLHDWKKAIAEKGADAFPGSGHLTPQEEEGRKLRAEIERLEVGRDTLKGATAFFATHASWSSPGSRNAGPSGRWRTCAACWACRARATTPGSRGAPVAPTCDARN